LDHASIFSARPFDHQRHAHDFFVDRVVAELASFTKGLTVVTGHDDQHAFPDTA